MRDELEEWYKAAERNTSGDMVYDILKDWKEDRALLKAEIERLTVELDNTPVEHLRDALRASESRHGSDSERWTDERANLLYVIKSLNACRNRMANAFNIFAIGAKNSSYLQEMANSFWAADQDFCQHLMSLGGYGIDRKSERVATAEKEAL